MPLAALFSFHFLSLLPNCEHHTRASWVKVLATSNAQKVTGETIHWRDKTSEEERGFSQAVEESEPKSSTAITGGHLSEKRFPFFQQLSHCKTQLWSSQWTWKKCLTKCTTTQTLYKHGTEGTSSAVSRTSMKIPQLSSHSVGQKQDDDVRSCHVYPTLTILDTLARAIRQEKKIKGIWLERKK